MSSETKPLITITMAEPLDSYPALPTHRDTTLIFQKKIQVLVARAHDYANDPFDEVAEANLLRVARGFTENS